MFNNGLGIIANSSSLGCPHQCLSPPALGVFYFPALSLVILLLEVKASYSLNSDCLPKQLQKWGSFERREPSRRILDHRDIPQESVGTQALLSFASCFMKGAPPCAPHDGIPAPHQGLKQWVLQSKLSLALSQIGSAFCHYLCRHQLPGLPAEL